MRGVGGPFCCCCYYYCYYCYCYYCNYCYHHHHHLFRSSPSLASSASFALMHVREDVVERNARRQTMPRSAFRAAGGRRSVWGDQCGVIAHSTGAPTQWNGGGGESGMGHGQKK